MEDYKKLEFEYAKLLRESDTEERRKLYSEAYSAVSKLAIKRFTSKSPEKRTAGTSKKLVYLLSKMATKNDRVLEVGCGRGYTCLGLAPYVNSIVGVDVSEPSIKEARGILFQHKIKNAEIKQCSAFELYDHFSNNEFTLCVSIDMFEHLHPEDAKEHLQQVFNVLKPGGKYIVIVPNRLNGPHDITKEEFPDACAALGFHLNESTYREMKNIMKSIGFNKFRRLYSLKFHNKYIKPLILPCEINFIAEILYSMLPNVLCPNIFDKLMTIKLIAYK